MGKHSKPTTHSATGPLMAVAIATSVPLTQGVAQATPAHATVFPSDDGWDSVSGAIATCESGNNPRARNPGSSASGAWQLLKGTWASVGGLLFAPTAAQATYDQQAMAARRLYARDGLNPWAASRSCWSHRIGRTARAARGSIRSVGVSLPRRTRGRHVLITPKPAKHGTYVVRAGDSLSSIAAAHGHTWQELFALNRAAVRNPSLIHTGVVINLP